MTGRREGRSRRWWWMVPALLACLLLVPFSHLGFGPRLRGLDRGSGPGPLRAGAAVAEMSIPLPATTVGYGWVRPEVQRAVLPLSARAVVLAAGEERVGLVTLDLLLADAGLVSAIRKSVSALGLSALWVAATHTHSSTGGFALNPVAQVVAAGRFRPEVRGRVVEAASRALTAAAGGLQPVEVQAGLSQLPKVTGSRDEFPEVDRRLTRVVLAGASGPLAQLVVVAAHPTLVARPPPGLDPDWPGRLSRREQEAGHGVTLVLQGEVGNVTVSRAGGVAQDPDAFARVVEAAIAAAPLRPGGVGLQHARVEVSLPGPDSSRVVPRPLATAVDTVLLWAWAPGWAEVSELQMGGVRLLGVPVETTAASGAVLEAASGGARVVSLANGYLGYVEPAERVVRGAGESPRQLLRPGLLDALRFGTEAARAALRPGSLAEAP